MTGVDEHRFEELRTVAEQVAGRAAVFVRQRRAEIFGSGADLAAVVGSKTTPTDAVTIVDTEAEQVARGLLGRLRPGDPVLGEEGGGAAGKPGEVRWVVDPIDGTVNFVYGLPAYAVSVAAQVDGVSVAGAVADVCGDVLYSAAAGHGAEVLAAGRRAPLRSSAVTELSMTLLGTGFGYEPRRRAAQAALVARLLPEVRDIRRIGSASLDLCLVAAGRLDAHYEHGLNIWDWAAGALIAAEAGAVVTLPDPAAVGGLLIAAAPGVADRLAEALARNGGLAPIP